MGIYKPGRPRKYTPLTREGNNPPSKPGEYRIRNESEEVVYIGETNNLRRRMQQHIRSGKMKTEETYTFEYKEADGRSTTKTRRLHEKTKIEQHNPLLNQRAGGGGRIANK